jgi:redox-sensitive bicupin YhaK (pirin superfamily)
VRLIKFYSKFYGRFLFALGELLKEPLVWRGTIEMNTQEELDKAFKEHDMGTFIKAKNL